MYGVSHNLEKYVTCCILFVHALKDYLKSISKHCTTLIKMVFSHCGCRKCAGIYWMKYILELAFFIHLFKEIFIQAREFRHRVCQLTQLVWEWTQQKNRIPSCVSSLSQNVDCGILKHLSLCLLEPLCFFMKLNNFIKCWKYTFATWRDVRELCNIWRISDIFLGFLSEN